jgi:prepilin-type N-terminal cleavage/methylation domain-containing protein
MNNQRGFTVIEMAISMTMFAVLLGIVTMSLLRDTSAQEVIVAHVGPEMKMRRVLHRIGVDLRMAGVWGENLNHSVTRTLEAGEDLNLNGVLDADWNLADGATAPELAFNTREDLLDSAGDVLATGVYSTKKRYLFQSGAVFKEVTSYGSGAPVVQRTRLADGIKSLTFSRSGGLVRVRAVVDVPIGGGDTRESVLETRVWLRN